LIRSPLKYATDLTDGSDWAMPHNHQSYNFTDLAMHPDGIKQTQETVIFFIVHHKLIGN
jgi:hypothetical protein